jgi:molecular chaperone GrpE
MSVGKDEQKRSPSDIEAEIDRTMAEAESAVEALESEEDGPDDEEIQPDPGERIEQLAQELEATKDKWLRAVAELENYKKRVKREIDEAVVRAIQTLLPAFLPAMDNLERALDVAELSKQDPAKFETTIEQLVKGIEMVRTEFMNALSRHGIEPVRSLGQPFDPAVHDALQQFDSPDHPPGVVIREFEKGYKMGARLLRPARVIVAGSGSTGTASEAATEE